MHLSTNASKKCENRDVRRSYEVKMDEKVKTFGVLRGQISVGWQ